MPIASRLDTFTRTPPSCGLRDESFCERAQVFLDQLAPRRRMKKTNLGQIAIRLTRFGQLGLVDADKILVSDLQIRIKRVVSRVAFGFVDVRHLNTALVAE